ncbi:unnamed protein product [Trichobilharzia regenti]|nr:unnamed protein product [Trichobilharzia regenti]
MPLFLHNHRLSPIIRIQLETMHLLHNQWLLRVIPIFQVPVLMVNHHNRVNILSDRMVNPIKLFMLMVNRKRKSSAVDLKMLLLVSG